MTEVVRVGLIGAGEIGRLRARAATEVPGLLLVAVADVRQDLAREAAGPGEGVRLFTDGRELAGQKEVDAVIVSTPPNSHEVLGRACLAAGKHVLIEKPLAPTVEACLALMEAAIAAERTIATGFNLRYTPAAALARRLLDEGTIGALDHIRSFHGHPGGSEFTHDWVQDASVTGGGALMDNGIHLIDLTRWFLGEVEEVKGFATNHTWRKEGCEDNGFLLLRSREGKVATLHASWTEWRGYGYRVELYGTEGFIRFGYPPMHLVHGQRGASGKVKTDRHLFPAYQVKERLRGWQWGLVETLKADLDGWARALAGGKQPPITGRDGLEAVRLARTPERA